MRQLRRGRDIAFRHGAEKFVHLAQLRSNGLQLAVDVAGGHRPNLDCPNPDARAVVSFNEAGVNEELDRLANRGASGAVHVRELALGRKPLSRGGVATSDEVGEEVGEALRLYGWPRHVVLDGPLLVCLWFVIGPVMVRSSCRVAGSAGSRSEDR